MAKRKRSTAAGAAAVPESSPLDIPRPIRRTEVPLPGNVAGRQPKPPRRQPSRGGNAASTNPNANPDVLDAPGALRASPDGGDEPALKLRRGNSKSAASTLDTASGAPPSTVQEAYATTEVSAGTAAGGSDGRGRATTSGGGAETHALALNTGAPSSETAAAELPAREPGKTKRKKAPTQHVKEDSAVNGNSEIVKNEIAEQAVGVTVDPENEEGPKDDEEDEAEIKEALSRPPAVNSDYLPLPWKGRLGYACLNTYLRNANPPVFSSRTCRIASILEHRHPLKDPSQPEHATKNRPDKDQPADVARGQRWVEELGLANARDIIKMLRWNDKYGIRFMRLSSEMFPFASHDVYGYKLAPFAADTLEEVGKVVAELGHRVTTHPGQFTQLGSPRKEVITASYRDLNFHDEMLSLLKLPPQQDRDAVMILHLGGAFGDKPATLDRFRENYAKCSESVKKRLVLENDDVVWSVHDLLPLCQELNIPFVLDFHHHNIIFDSDKIREGTKDIVELFPAILETWHRKGITPKMHYSEPCPEAVTNRSRRKHSPRVMTLPPCPDTMDLMIEAKDKEQAVFELMRTFKLPGFDRFADIVPHVRLDENRPWKPKPKKAVKKSRKKKTDDLEDLDVKLEEAVEEEEKPPPIVPDEDIAMGGPEGRVYWPPGQEEWLRPPKRVVKKKEEVAPTPAKKKRKVADAASQDTQLNGTTGEVNTPAKKAAPKKAASAKKSKKPTVPTPEPSDDDAESSPLSDLGEDEDDEVLPSKRTGTAPPAPIRKRSGRAGRVSYKEDEAEMSA
ncbi:UV-endonuclease UvdE-domain-containing protein [Lophiotrema nucula]|uniref:UV-endonuclease UvdE-domain-containing protein n=1 Tax=Lophiotrema nucula TaxID=690887 RepID=A0A6A5Z8E8_9PLEO|nr:UV-endonuclease UvdE-domain-containing protein [Lophiotrema nucula]